MNPPFLFQIRINEEYAILYSINTEELAVEATKIMISELKEGTNLNKKFRLYMGPSYGYKYFNLETETFQFEVA